MSTDLFERVRRCPHFICYDSAGGPVVYCQLAAFARRMRPGQLRLIGCTEEVRAACAKVMELACGFSSVPEPAEAEGAEEAGDAAGAGEARRKISGT